MNCWLIGRAKILVSIVARWVGSMEVRVGKKLAMREKKKKKRSKVSSQKRLTVVECWLT